MVPSPNPCFIVYENARCDESYMYSYTDYTYSVVSVETGDELYRFSGDCDEDSAGLRESGTSSVRIEADQVVERDFEENVTRHPLPSRVEIVDEGAAIELTWPDGRTEKRARKAATYTLKGGMPMRFTELQGLPTVMPGPTPGSR